MTSSEVIKSCTVKGGQPCEKFFNVTTSNIIVNGNCFTFNGKAEVGELRTGPGAGMEIEFKLFREEFSFTPCLLYTSDAADE